MSKATKSKWRIPNGFSSPSQLLLAAIRDQSLTAGCASFLITCSARLRDQDCTDAWPMRPTGGMVDIYYNITHGFETNTTRLQLPATKGQADSRRESLGGVLERRHLGSPPAQKMAPHPPARQVDVQQIHGRLIARRKWGTSPRHQSEPLISGRCKLGSFLRRASSP